MAKNFKIADINRNARYTVTATDHDDGHAETREMTGADLVSFTNAAAHLYDIHAEEIAEPQEAQDNAEIMQQAGAVTLPQRVALYVPGTQGPATAADNTDRQIIQALAIGLTVRAIASALGMSKSAVQRRINSIRSRYRAIA